MVSADNLNLDCLELIFAYLSGNDLVHVSLVSRSFLAAVIPRLYRTLTFGLQQAKKYPSVCPPDVSCAYKPIEDVSIRSFHLLLQCWHIPIWQDMSDI